MEQDNFDTPVVFRKSRGKDPDITAVFPCQAADMDGLLMTCYVHIGQHGGCGHQWYNSTRAAKPSEYADLQRELESLGYRLKVYKRIQPWMRDQMQAAVRATREVQS